MSRSSWKPKNIQIDKNQKQKNKIYASRSIIIENWMMKKSFWCHNGLKWIKVNISKPMLGYRLGEFVSTRKYNKKK